MEKVSRRSFVTSAAAGITALSVLGAAGSAADAQLVWNASEWKLAEFDKLAKTPARVKVVYNVESIDDGGFLASIKNNLNGLTFGFKVPESQIKIVAGLHGAANLLNYDDYVWSKYRIGEHLKINDPETGKPAVRNVFYPSRHDAASKDPSDEKSMYQDYQIQTLQSRGVQFLSCHTATEEQARGIIRKEKLSQKPEEVVQDMLAHTLPGVLVVASMVSAVTLLQVEGHYAFLMV
jgi:intracellular sulfur oxidation DsrE/DsrF family protein